MHRDLITSLSSYKAMMEFKLLDFEADKKAQYDAIRVMMAEKYAEKPELFGVPSLDEHLLTIADESEKQQAKKLNEQLIKNGHNRVLHKIKAIRQDFSTAVVQGTRSGSGKVVFMFYDELKMIYGGSASVAPLDCGVSSASGDMAEEILASGNILLSLLTWFSCSQIELKVECFFLYTLSLK